MSPGDTYIRASKHIEADPHLWVVISDPSKDGSKLVAVSLTSQRPDKDQCCVIYPGEHSFIEHETVVSYQHARVVPESALIAAFGAGLLKKHDKTNPSLLAKIRKGAAYTDQLPLVAKRVLQDQGIIPREPRPDTRTPHT